MSIRTEIDKLDKKQRIDILSKLGFQHPKNDMKWIYPYYISNDDVYVHIPYNYGLTHGFSAPVRSTYPRATIQFSGELREYQREVKREVINELNHKGSTVLSLHVGWGKSVLALYLAYKLKLKTLIIVNKLVLIKQWMDLIESVCPDSSVQFIKTKSVFDRDCDFYLINAQNVPKMGEYYFEDIGTLICDEIHLLCAATLYKSMFYIYPRYMIGLSATPHRPDGLDVLIDLYFGTHRITKKLYREHTVYPIHTGYKLKHGFNHEGKIDWNSLLNSQAEHVERNELIINIVKKFHTRAFLILCKRISQGTFLFDRLNEEQESVTHLLGSKKDYDPEARILIATTQKCGVGFSHNKLNTLLLASDMEEYFIQYLGRVFRTPESTPFIFDIVDEHPVLKRHFSTRKKVYKDAGGCIHRASNGDKFLKLNLKE